ncbi:phosphatidylserine synthase 2 [Russula earlei]|uniref:Phosphatidylserine synthase 2 n=1 Tax=Russula earlei TaxID=71964 RepID=A0ACC0TX97_9AGAM|nr:phosphatidylserine synthase 2 [Russula earlei]
MQPSSSEDDEHLSPTSQTDDTDPAATTLAPEAPEPAPVVPTLPIPVITHHGVFILQADRTEPYTRIEPFQERQDTSVEFFYKPVTLTALAAALAALGYVAMTQDVLEEGRDKRRMGVYAAIAGFLVFSMIQFRDGPFIRPHPAFWRVVLGVNLLYELALVFLLFQDLNSARAMMTYLDPNLGRPLPEKSYAENCAFTPRNIWNAIDIFCWAHMLGWFGKALVLRDYWFCWILSVAFELAEYSLQHQLPNFAECWWDHWLLDVLICNWLGTYIGMKTCQYFEVKHYTWRGFRQSRGIGSKTKRVITQFSPHDFTAFHWHGTASLLHYVTVVMLLAVFLAGELNPFYLKSLLWMEPEHRFVSARLFGVKAVRMGQHVWLMLATIGTELLVIVKWSKGRFPTPLPTHVRVAWLAGAALLILYPVGQFGVPSARRYLRRKPRIKGH